MKKMHYSFFHSSEECHLGFKLALKNRKKICCCFSWSRASADESLHYSGFVINFAWVFELAYGWAPFMSLVYYIFVKFYGFDVIVIIFLVIVPNCFLTVTFLTLGVRNVLQIP